MAASLGISFRAVSSLSSSAAAAPRFANHPPAANAAAATKSPSTMERVRRKNIQSLLKGSRLHAGE